jgi:hypothetical protein
MRQVHEVANLVPVLAKVGYMQPCIGFWGCDFGGFGQLLVCFRGAQGRPGI